MWSKKCSLIGMLHLPPMPGAADYCGSVDRIIESTLAEAKIYKENGFDALMLENMHDVPYLCGAVEPETTAAMAVVAKLVKMETSMPVGIQILAGANIEALGAAVASSLDFIRVEGFVFAHVGDEGMHNSCAGKLIRRRNQLRADHIKIFADIKKKHSSHSITSDISLAETARAAEFFRTDGVIVTGDHTGQAPSVEDVAEVRDAVSCAVLIGSGVDAGNIAEFAETSDALMVGSSVKSGGRWQNELVREQVAALSQLLRY